MGGDRTRRAFLSYVAAGIAGAGCSAANSGPGPASPRDAPSPPAAGRLQTRVLGATGERVSIIGLGGFHIGVPEKKEALAIMHRAIDNGITFFDNCWDYHVGESERRMGEALEGGRRDRVFLMSKIDGRSRRAAAEQLDQSLKRLRTDRVDLMQIHEVIRFEDAESVFGEDGAVQALLDAKKAGKVRYIGFTGHKDPAIHLAMLESAKKHEFHYDAVQMPVNAMDPHFKSFEKQVIPVLLERSIGILGMKSLGSGKLVRSGVVTAEECLRYALSARTDVVITGIDSEKILDQAIAVASDFVPMPEADRLALLERTRDAGKDGHLEEFKTTSQFDGTAKHPEWLTTAEL